MHSFDYSYLEDEKLVIRRAGDGEKITTLDEKEFELNSQNLVICDENKPQCLAGIMGGIHGTDTTVIVSNCVNEGKVTGNHAGGLVGCLWGKSVLTSSTNKGTVSGSNTDPICVNKESGNISGCVDLSSSN
jgi:hypothetical protein